MPQKQEKREVELNFKFRFRTVLKEPFNLSDGEEEFIVNARIGQGILVTPEGRLPFYNMLSDGERRLFTTRPKELWRDSGSLARFTSIL